MKSKLLSLILILTIVSVSTIPSFAIEGQTSTATDINTSDILALVPPGTSTQIIEEIEALKAAEMASIYEQLVAQDAVDMLSDYENIITVDITNYVLRKNNILEEGENVVQANLSYEFIHGGTVQNVAMSGKHAISTYYDFDDSYYYILKKNSFFSISNIVTTILGFNPYLGTIFSAASLMNTYCSSSAYNNVLEADGYAKIINLRHPVTVDASSVMTGWYDYPYASTYAYNGDSSTLSYRAFPERNPFEED